MAFRFVLLTLFFSFLYASLGWKLYRLQIDQSFYYFEKAQARNEFLKEKDSYRGLIFFTDRYGNNAQVAMNRLFPVIYAVPGKIKEPAATAAVLAPIIGWETKELTAVLDNPKSAFRLLVDKASAEQVQQLKDSALAGVYADYDQHRYYPLDNSASQLLGFVGINEKIDAPTGLYGVEKLFNADLAAGKDIRLTIDRVLQTQSESILSNLIAKYEAAGGLVLVQEPATGKILAMAGQPDFNPNNYSQSPLRNFLNPAVQFIYEPGSVVKVLTMAAGIDSGAITPATVFTDTGSVTLNAKTIKNWDGKAYGKITMTEVIEHSVNTGAVFAEKKTGHQSFYEYLENFGLGELTGIDLPDETAGNVKFLNGKNVRDIDWAAASFGQGIAVTPIGLINAFSAIANGGVVMKPYLNAEKEPTAIGRVIKEETSRQLTAMMESAVEKAAVAAISSYRVAGKTGTAQLPDFENGGYSDQFIHSYVGFAPAGNPKFTILIKLDKPKATLAGATVVPAFRELAEFILNYYNIPPDKL